jgi:hypothetical protein
VCEIKDAAGRADNHVRAGADLTDIQMTGCATHRKNDLDIGELSEGTDDRGDLLGR